MKDVFMSYDGSFEGFLSVVFDIYKNKISPSKIDGRGMPLSLFATKVMAVSSEEKAKRVLNGIVKKSNKKLARFIYEIFLSEIDDVELKLLHLIRYILSGKAYKIQDFSDAIIVDLHRIKKMIGREVHRMHAFVRFQETKDNMWACEINPDFNVLPLIGKHFKDRYPRLEWIIFDINRNYGIHFDLEQIHYVTFKDKVTGKIITSDKITNEEKSYQSMWKQYFKSVNIEERNNEKLHIRHVPKRYWKFLIEKQT